METITILNIILISIGSISSCFVFYVFIRIKCKTPPKTFSELIQLRLQNNQVLPEENSTCTENSTEYQEV